MDPNPPRFRTSETRGKFSDAWLRLLRTPPECQQEREPTRAQRGDGDREARLECDARVGELVRDESLAIGTGETRRRPHLGRSSEQGLPLDPPHADAGERKHQRDAGRGRGAPLRRATREASDRASAAEQDEDAHHEDVAFKEVHKLGSRDPHRASSRTAPTARRPGTYLPRQFPGLDVLDQHTR